MNRLLRMLWRPFALRKVDDEIVADFAGIFESRLARRGLKGIASAPLLKRLTEEAYNRAALEESDRVPRYGAMWDQVEDITDKVAELFDGNNQGDPAIDAILVFHGVKEPR